MLVGLNSKSNHSTLVKVYVFRQSPVDQRLRARRESASRCQACAAELETLKQEEKSEREIIGWGTAQLSANLCRVPFAGIQCVGHLLHVGQSAGFAHVTPILLGAVIASAN